MSKRNFKWESPHIATLSLSLSSHGDAHNHGTWLVLLQHNIPPNTSIPQQGQTIPLPHTLGPNRGHQDIWETVPTASCPAYPANNGHTQPSEHRVTFCSFLVYPLAQHTLGPGPAIQILDQLSDSRPSGDLFLTCFNSS